MKKTLLFIAIAVLFLPLVCFSQNKSKEERKAELEAKKQGIAPIEPSIEKFTGTDCGFPSLMPCNNGLVEYQSIMSVAGKSQSEVFDLARQWFTSAFRSGKSTVDYSNPENGKIIGKGYFDFQFFNRGDQSIGFTISIDSKDNKLRYTITDITYYQSAIPSYKSLALEKNNWRIENYPRSWGFKTRFYKDVDYGVRKVIDNLETFFSNSENINKEW